MDHATIAQREARTSMMTSMPLTVDSCSDISIPEPAREAAASAAGSLVRLDRATLLANRIFGLERQDSRAQAFMNLRSQVLRRLARVSARVLAVTSTQPSNGKSFVAANLASVLSRIHPVYLVDLDLKRPAVAKGFGLPPGLGVDDVLLGRCAWEQAGCRVEGENLTILPAREPKEDVSGLLTSPHMAALFTELRALPSNCVCIVDTPPMFEDDDMMIVARHVDAILLVVEEGRTSQRELREALRLMAPTPLLGTVLNRSITPSLSSNYGHERYGGHDQQAQ